MSEPPPYRPKGPDPDPDQMWPPPGTGPWLVGTLAIWIAILGTKLYPFQFSSPGAERLLSLDYAGPAALLAQVLLFLPLGLVEAQLARRLVGGFMIAAFLMVAADGLLLAMIGETLQYWVVGRRSSIIDVLANVLGTSIGYMFSMHLTQMRSRQ